MKNHFKRTGIFLLYTLVFNIISFLFYFIPAFANHNFTGIVWILFGITQICFTVLYFSNVPLFKVSYEKGAKTDLLIYFFILCILSIVIAFYRAETDSWFTYIFFNTFYPLTSSVSLLDNIKVYIFVCIAENAIKAYCLYRNTKNKHFSKTVFTAIAIITALLYFIFIVVLAVIS